MQIELFNNYSICKQLCKQVASGNKTGHLPAGGVGIDIPEAGGDVECEGKPASAVVGQAVFVFRH